MLVLLFSRGASVRFGHRRADRGRYRDVGRSRRSKKPEPAPAPETKPAFDSLTPARLLRTHRRRRRTGAGLRPAGGSAATAGALRHRRRQHRSRAAGQPATPQPPSTPSPPPAYVASRSRSFRQIQCDAGAASGSVCGLPPRNPATRRRALRCSGVDIRPTSRPVSSRSFGVISGHARNCRHRSRRPTSSRSSCGCS